MDLWEKLTEAMEQLQEKKDSFHSLMGLLTLEWEDASTHLASANTSLKECINDQEALLEKRKTKLDSNEVCLAAMKDCLRSKETELERRKVGLESREAELNSKEKCLEAMEDGLRSKETDLERRKVGLDSREAELASEEKCLEAMKDGLRSKETELERRKVGLDSREAELVSKEKWFEDGLRSKENDMERRQPGLDLREVELDSRGRCLETMKERPISKRKPVKRLLSAIYNHSSKEFRVENGPGATALKDIPNVAYKLSRKGCDETFKALHRILFSRRGKAGQIMGNISHFSGFIWHENEEKQKLRLKERLNQHTKERLVEICEVLDVPVPKASTRKDIVVKLMEFLEAPHATASELPTEKEQVEQSSKGVKRKRTSHGSASESASSKGLAKSRKKADDVSEKKPSAPMKAKSELTDDELRAAISEILKQVDFNKATFSDTLKQLAVRLKTDMTSRKSSIQRMIQDELTKLADDADDEEAVNEGEGEKENQYSPSQDA